MGIVLERVLSLLPRTPDGKFVRGAKKEFADKLGIDKNIVSQWQAGTNKSYNRYLYQIADLYGVSVTWLLGETDDPAPQSSSATDQREELKRLLLDVVPKMTDAEIFDLMRDITAARENKSAARKEDAP